MKPRAPAGVRVDDDRPPCPSTTWWGYRNALHHHHPRVYVTTALSTHQVVVGMPLHRVVGVLHRVVGVPHRLVYAPGSGGDAGTPWR